ncbi:MAG: hypothetical protein PVJ39_16350 [Gammaproteobacteria bacterium]
MNQARKSRSINDNNSHDHFNGAAIIDRFGNEIPITEQMVQQAFRTLIDAWENRQVRNRTP